MVFCKDAFETRYTSSGEQVKHVSGEQVKHVSGLHLPKSHLAKDIQMHQRGMTSGHREAW